MICLTHTFSAPTESYFADFNNPQNHGDFIIGSSLNEKVKNGKWQASAVVVTKPNTHPSELPFLKAVSTGNTLEITSLAHKGEFLAQKVKWMKLLEDNKDFLEADTLLASLNTMCTRIKKGRDPNRKRDDTTPLRPVLKKTIIKVEKAGVTFSHDYFALKDGSLDLLPLPYSYDVKIADETFSYSESMVVWRAYIEDSAEPVDDEDGASQNPTMDRLALLMKGTKLH